MRTQQTFILSMRGCCLVSLAAAGLGCGANKPVPVAGKVTLDGQPLADAGVVFTPEGGGRPAYGNTEADGSFRLIDGALPGTYTVTITWDGPAPVLVREGDVNLSREEILTRVQVEAEKRSKLAKTSRVPAVYGDPSRTPLKQKVPPDGKVIFELDSKAR